MGATDVHYACTGGFLIWIVLAGYAFGGSFDIEVEPGGDLGFASYSEAGHRAPAPPAAPIAPDPELQNLASFRAKSSTSNNADVGLTATSLLHTLAANQLTGNPFAPTTKNVDSNRMSAQSMNTIVQNVRRQVYSQERLSYMQAALGQRRVTTEQLSTLLGLLNFSDDRLALIDQASNNLVDIENYPSLYRFFPFETDREAVSAAFR